MGEFKRRIILEALRKGTARELEELGEQDGRDALGVYDLIDVEMVPLETEVKKTLRKRRQTHHTITILSRMFARMVLLAERCLTDQEATELMTRLGMKRTSPNAVLDSTEEATD